MLGIVGSSEHDHEEVCFGILLIVLRSRRDGALHAGRLHGKDIL